MIQKWGAKRAIPVSSRLNRHLLRKSIAVRWVRLGIVALGALLISQVLLPAKVAPPNASANDIIIIILPPPFQPPKNDRFTNAAPITGINFSVTRSLPRGTSEPGEPPHEGHTASYSIWWRWTAPQNGFVEVNVPGVSISIGSVLTNLALPAPVYVGFYTGTLLTNLTPVPLLSGSSTNIGTDSLLTKTYLFPVIAGETYYLATDCASSYSFTFSFANLVLTQPATFSDLPANQFVTVEFSPFDTNFDIANLVVFAGTNLLPVSNLNPLQFQFTPAGEFEVPIRAIGTNTGGQLLVSLTNTLTFHPRNDSFADATAVSPNSSGSFSENTTLATDEPGEPEIVPGQMPAHTVWWRWRPPYNVATEVRLTSPSSRLALFKGTNISNLELVGNLERSPSLPYWSSTKFSFTPEPGAVYSVVGEGSPVVSWDFDQETLVMTPTGSQQALTDFPIELQAIWLESNAPSSSVEFVIGRFPGIVFGAPPEPVEIGLAGSRDSSPYRVMWTPTDYGTFYLRARCTNEFGSLRESPWTSFQIFISNDDFTNATVIPSHTRSASITFNTRGASTEIGELRHRNEPALATRWWTWTPSYSGSVRIKAVRELQAVPLDIFVGDSLNNIRPIASNWKRTYRIGISGALDVGVHKGKAYFIRVDDTSPNSHHTTIPESDITLSLEPATNRPHAELLLSLQKKPFATELEGPGPSIALVLMPDESPLSGSDFRVQLYAGTDAVSLAAVGPAQPFYQYPSSYLGTPVPVPVILPNMKAYSRVFAQLRVWDLNDGNSYESAKASGGLIGESKILNLVAGSEDSGAAPLRGLRSFTLHTP